MTTAYMLLSLPIVSTTLGPAWATQLNSALTTVDGHDHTSGKGAKVPSSGININASLAFGGYSATGLATAVFNDQGSALSAATVGALYIAAGELYYNNGSGTSLKITNGGALNASSLGGFGGDYATSTAAAVYWTASKSFQYTQSSNVAALVDAGPIQIRKVASWSAVPQGAGLPGLTLAVGAAISTPWTLTLPAAVPGANNSFAVVSTAGVASYVTADASTVEVNGTTLRAKDLGITTAKLAASSVTNPKLANFNIVSQTLAAPIVASKYQPVATGFEGGWTKVMSATFNRQNSGRPVKIEFDSKPTDVATGPTYGWAYADVDYQLTQSGYGSTRDTAVAYCTSTAYGGGTSQIKCALMDMTAGVTMSSWVAWQLVDVGGPGPSGSITLARSMYDYQSIIPVGSREIALQVWFSGSNKFSASLTMPVSSTMYISEF